MRTQLEQLQADDDAMLRLLRRDPAGWANQMTLTSQEAIANAQDAGHVATERQHCVKAWSVATEQAVAPSWRAVRWIVLLGVILFLASLTLKGVMLQ